MKKKEAKNQKKTQQNQIQIKRRISIKDTILEHNKEFDETIYFNHHYTAFRKLSVEKPISQITIPFLMIREFLFSYFEEKLINREADKESISQILGHIKQFSNSHDTNFILNFLENIKTYAEIIGMKNTSNILVPALAKIVDESYHVKMQFLKSLLPFIDYLCSNGDEGILLLKNNMLNILQELFHQKNDQLVTDDMKKLLFKNFIKIAKAILPYDKEQYILNIIIGFGNEDNFRNNISQSKNNSYKNQQVDEHKILCIKYIRQLVEGFGKDNAERYLLPQLISFTCEKNEEIKKELLYTLPNISEIISFDFISNKIYDILRRLSNDLDPNIRKISVNVTSKIIKIFKNKCEEDKLLIKENNIQDNKKVKNYSAKNFVSLIEKLTKDKENIVKFTIIEKIGEIIASLDKDELSNELFNFYKKFSEKFYEEKKRQFPLGASIQTGSSSHGSSGNNLFLIKEKTDEADEMNDMDKEYNKQIKEEELNYYFAYNFPAILYCYGKKAWPELKNIYYDFCFEEDLKIRLSIIASFHEIVNILGKEITENELIPIYDKFLESNEKYEQKLAIKNLPKILLRVNKSLKERYFKYFEPVSIFIDNTGSKVRNFNFINWKNKLNVIEGILCYYNLYDNDIIYNSILPQCITFSLDKFYKVRKTSSKVIATLIVYLYKENYKKEKLIKILENFAFHKKFKIRINFIKMCPILLGDESLYNEKIKELIEIIVNKDKILDVKIALSKVLKKIINDEKSPLKGDDFIHKICNILNKNDFIKTIFKGTRIKDINDDNNKIEDKIYFKEDNSFFIEEFKLEIEKKENSLFDVPNKKTKNIEENEKDKDKDKETIEIKEDKKDEIKEDKKIDNEDEKKEEKDETIVKKKENEGNKVEETKTVDNGVKKGDSNNQNEDIKNEEIKVVVIKKEDKSNNENIEENLEIKKGNENNKEEENKESNKNENEKEESKEEEKGNKEKEDIENEQKDISKGKKVINENTKNDIKEQEEINNKKKDTVEEKKVINENTKNGIKEKEEINNEKKEEGKDNENKKEEDKNEDSKVEQNK